MTKSYTIGGARNKTWIYLNIFRFFLGLTVVLLLAIGALSATKTVMNSAYNFQIDTRTASIDDVLGNVKVYPVALTTTTSTATPSITDDIALIESDKTTSTHTISATRAAQAEDTLDYIKITLKKIADPQNGYLKEGVRFSLANTFLIHDRLVAATNGFRCYSTNSLGEATFDEIFYDNELCPMNGFFQCLGNFDGTVESIYGTSAYHLSANYLQITTTLSTDQINDLYSNWTSITSYLLPGSLRLNIPQLAYLHMKKVSCKNDDKFYDRGTFQNDNISKLMGMAIAALAFMAIGVLFDFYLTFFKYVSRLCIVITHCFLVILSIALNCAWFGSNFSPLSSAANIINNDTDGIKAYATLQLGHGGSGVYFVVTLIFSVTVLLIQIANYISNGKSRP